MRSAYITLVCLAVGMLSPLLSANAQQVQNKQGISFVTGGVGMDERETIRAMAGDFSLKLRFAEKNGAYRGSVQVRIEDAQGRPVLESASDGPWFMVALPSGSFTVVASDPNEELRKKVQVQQGSMTEAIFRFQDG